jgi:hypothetical protein
MIASDETEIIGNWIFRDGRMIGDERCERVHRLTKDYLVKIGSDSTGWDTLFRDPRDNRFWERIYLQSYMHGGGPPSLRCISEAEAATKYSDLLNNNRD